MPAKRWIAIGLVLFSTALGASAGDNPDLETLASLMSGSFASTEQAEAGDEFLDVRLHVVQIWEGLDDGYIWLYVEQALATSQERPYRQRVYRLSHLGSNEFASAVFELPGDPLAMAEAWKTPSKLDSIRPEQLVEREGCVVFLRRESPTRFSGTTKDRECTSSLRGAAYATTHVNVTKEALTSWDRGYDADGDQVWGSTKGAYVFKRLDK
jgi:hypothetical protein